MKNKRQNKILEIISREAIETQEELIKRLQDEGYNVTQATISRDIKELKLIKSAHGDKYRYVQSVSGEAKKDAKYDSILMELCPWDFPGKSTGVGCHCLLRIRT